VGEALQRVRKSGGALSNETESRKNKEGLFYMWRESGEQLRRRLEGRREKRPGSNLSTTTGFKDAMSLDDLLSKGKDKEEWKGGKGACKQRCDQG